MPDDTPANPAATALGFSITAGIHSTAQIVLQSFIPLDATADDINAVLDKTMAAIDRQQAKYKVKDIRQKLEMEEAQLADQVSKLADLQNAYANEHATTGRRGEFKLSANQQAAVNNARKTIEGMKFNVDRGKTNLADLEAMAK